MNESLEVRELLAKERTFLSLDRTLLSYIRTSMTTIVVGISFFKLFDIPAMQIGGILLIIVALILTVVGIVRSVQLYKKISEYTSEK